jgi:hypothetical protein
MEGDLDLARWLFRSARDNELKAALLQANTTGDFFKRRPQKPGHCTNWYYRGGFPLSFAVCHENLDMVDLLWNELAKMDRVDLVLSRDQNGYNLLHCAVERNLPQM